MRDTSLIEINLAAVTENIRVLRQLAAGSGLCAVLKADGYGLGAVRIARTLVDAGVDMLAVYTPEQAAQLARSGVIEPILVMMPVVELHRTDELYRSLVSGRLHLTVHGEDHLRALLAIADRFGSVIPLHVEVDTGMSRGGASPAELKRLLPAIAEARNCQLAGIFTHFASAETAGVDTQHQRTLFEKLIGQHRDRIPKACLVHAANTFATLRDESLHYDMVRVGLAWAGYGPDWMEVTPERFEGVNLRPSVRWSSSLVHVKWIEKGARVGYGGEWMTPRRSRIGLIPVGYADGYPINCGWGNGDPDAQPRAQVGVYCRTPGGDERRFAPVVGAINMDQIAIDLTHLNDLTVGVGSEAELISPDPAAPNHVPTLAKAAGTIPHEVLTRLNSRIPRTHVARDVQIEVMPSRAALVG